MGEMKMVDVTSVTSMLSNIGMMLLLVIFFGIVTFAAMYGMSQWKKWSQFTCVIWGKDGFGQIVEKSDKAGIFIDRKTKNKRFYIRKAKVGLECNNIPYIQKGRGKIVYLLQTGLKNFKFIKPTISDGQMKFDVGEEDVNWAINEYEKQKRLFDQNVLLQYLPFIALGFTSIIILIMFIYFFKQFPTLVNMAEALKEAAVAFAQSQGGTTILQ